MIRAILDEVEIGEGLIRTSRLELVSATPAMLRADLERPDRLGAVLVAAIPLPGWPPDEWEPPAVEWMLRELEASRAPGGYGAWYFIRAADRLLVGAGGFKGPPDETGTVEIGYSIVAPVQRQGLATEAALGLTAFAFRDARVRRVAAETLPHLDGSLGVLRKLGFAPAEAAAEPGVVRLELRLPG